MPCYNTGSERGDRELESREARKKATKATRAACAALKLLTPEQIEALPKATRLWWKNHQKVDSGSKKG